MDIKILVVFIMALVAGTSGTPTCTTGQYVDGGGGCTDCPAGTYGPDAIACVDCDYGTWSDSVGAASSSTCDDCPGPKTTLQTGTTSKSDCVRCPIGTKEVADQCEPCPIGFYQDRTGQTSCKECPDNLTSPSGSDDVGDCDSNDCDPGYWFDDSGPTCYPCTIGYYQPDADQDSCIRCKDGFTTAGSNSIHKRDCTRCPIGTKEDGSRVCVPCPTGFYQKRTGQTDCKPCKFGQTTPGTGSDERSDCYFDSCSNMKPKCDEWAPDRCEDDSLRPFGQRTWRQFMEIKCRLACGECSTSTTEPPTPTPPTPPTPTP